MFLSYKYVPGRDHIGLEGTIWASGFVRMGKMKRCAPDLCAEGINKFSKTVEYGSILSNKSFGYNSGYDVCNFDPN